MQITVTDKCSGHGRCYTLANDVYEDDEVGYNAAIGQTFAVSADRAEHARWGAINCPEAAILISE